MGEEIDYWSKFKLNECWSERERFNIIMNYIDEKLGENEDSG